MLFRSEIFNKARMAGLNRDECSAWHLSDYHQKFSLHYNTQATLRDLGVTEYSLYFHRLGLNDIAAVQEDYIRTFNTQQRDMKTLRLINARVLYIPAICFRSDREYVAAKMLYG